MHIATVVADVTTRTNAVRIAAMGTVRRAKPPIISLAVGVMDIDTSPNAVDDTITQYE